jgi:hypothetical protein
MGAGREFRVQRWRGARHPRSSHDTVADDPVDSNDNHDNAAANAGSNPWGADGSGDVEGPDHESGGVLYDR